MSMATFRLFLSLVCLFFILSCGRVTLDGSEPESGTAPEAGEDRTAESDGPPLELIFEGGELRPNAISESGSYIVDVGVYASSLTVIMPEEEGSSVLVYLSTNPDTVEDDIPLSFDDDRLVIPLEAAEVSNATITFAVTRADGEVREYTYAINRNIEDEFEQVLNLASLSGLELSSNDLFGSALDLDNGRVAVGIRAYDGGGAVAIFEQDAEGEWEYTILRAPNAQAGDQFGRALALSKGVLAVGAPAEDGDASSQLGNYNDGLANSGAVYIFVLDEASNTWEALHYIKSSSPASLGLFGYVLDLWVPSDSTEAQLVVLDFAGNTIETFVRNVVAASENVEASDTFMRVNMVTAGTSTAAFGSAQGTLSADSTVKLSQDYLLVGLPLAHVDHDNSLSTRTINAGRVLVYRKDAVSFTQMQVTRTNYDFIGNESNSQFGTAMAIDGHQLVIGAPGTSSSSTNDFAITGAVYTYVFDGTNWGEEQVIRPSNTVVGDRFGSALALSNNILAIGASGNDGDASTTLTTVIDPTASGHVEDSGSIFIYRGYDDLLLNNDLYWKLDFYGKASDASVNDAFGFHIILDSNGTVFASAVKGEIDTAQAGSNTGSVYVFQ